MRRLTTWMAGIAASLIPMAAMAQGTIEIETGTGKLFGLKMWLAIAAGLTITIASGVGAISQGKVAAVAMEGISRNPEAASKVMTPMIISLALIESLVIYALVIAFLLQGKI